MIHAKRGEDIGLDGVDSGSEHTAEGIVTIVAIESRTDKIIEFAVDQAMNKAWGRANSRGKVKHRGILRRRLAEGPSTCQKEVVVASSIGLHIDRRRLPVGKKKLGNGRTHCGSWCYNPKQCVRKVLARWKRIYSSCAQ